MSKIWMILLTICLVMFGVANAESSAAVYEKTINVHDSLPPYPSVSVHT